MNADRFHPTLPCERRAAVDETSSDAAQGYPSPGAPDDAQADAHPHAGAPNAAGPQPQARDVASGPAPDPAKPRKTAAEYAETFNKAVDIAEKALRVAPFPPAVKRVANRAMPTVKKVAKAAPKVAPVAEPYVRKAAEKAKEVAPDVARAAKAGAKTVAAGAQSGAKAAASGAKTVAGHVRETAPKLGHAVAGGAKAAATRMRDEAPKLGRAAADTASRLAAKLKREDGEG